VATADGGVVKGVSAGEADISASYQNVTGKVHVTIAPQAAATANLVSVTGTAPSVGVTTQFSATATLSDNTSKEVTNVASWSSSNTSVATVNNGQVKGIAAGEADISATYQNATGTAHVVVATGVAPVPVPVPVCAFSVSPTSLSVPSAARIMTVNVLVDQGTNCNWTATSNASFVTILSGASGTGNGVTAISVAANTGAARSAVLTIAGRQVTVSQDAGTCVTLVNPGGVNFPPEFGEEAITVSALPGCQWIATSNVPFITFPFGASGTGDGSVIYRLPGNLTGASRSGSIAVKQFTVNITQRAAVGFNSLSFVSDAGDFIGQGWTVVAESPYSSVTPTLDASRNHISFHISSSFTLRRLDWTLDFAAPQGQQLKPGTYLNATRYGSQAPAVPGLGFSGDGRSCNTVSGQFTITDAVFGTDGSVQRFAASFEQHCNGAGPALRGNISFGR